MGTHLDLAWGGAPPSSLSRLYWSFDTAVPSDEAWVWLDEGINRRG
jgi:hypothetical protein